MTVVRTSDGRLMAVRPAPEADQAWLGTPVKRTANGYVAKSGAVERLIRRAGCTSVEG